MNQRPAPRAPKMTRAALERAAIHHLQRYPASREQLRRVLMRRLQRAERRSAPGEGPDRAEAVAEIERLCDALVQRGALDDARLAAALAQDWLRGGNSPAMIRNKLRSKGIQAELAKEACQGALEAAREQGADPEVAAAAAYARRRRLGPFRLDQEQRMEVRQKDLASLGRRGFSFDIARKVIDAEHADDLPDPLL